MLVFVFIVIFFSFLYYYGIKPYYYWEKKGVPTYQHVPFFGNVGSNVIRRKAYVELLNDVYKEFPNNRYVGFYQFQKPALIIRDVELIKKLFVKNFDIFTNHWSFVPEDVDPLWGRNLFSILDKDRWREMRSALTPMFTTSKMKTIFDIMKTCAKQYTELYVKQETMVEIEFKDFFKRFANDVIASIAFGVSCNSIANPNNELFCSGSAATDFTGLNGFRFLLAALSPTIMKLLRIGIFGKKPSQFFRSIIGEAVTHREINNIHRPDLIHHMLELRRNNLHNAKKIRITDDDITAQALLFFFAAFDTISGVLSFTMYELALNSNIQERLRLEVDKAIEVSGGELSYDAIQRMKYLDMVLTESLRKWPITILTDRISCASYTLESELPDENPVKLDVGTNIWVPIFSIHRDAKHYPDPEIFDPERFGDENKHNLNPLAYLPFGTGPRNCIGARFGILECKIIITEMLLKYKIVKIQRTQVPLKMHITNIPLLAENGIWLGLKPRDL